MKKTIKHWCLHTVVALFSTGIVSDACVPNAVGE